MRTLVPVALVVLIAAGAGARPLTLPQQLGSVDLSTQANVVFRGAGAGDQAGTAVAPAGDINGDGRTDVVIGAPGADDNGRQDSGTAYVVFGATSPAEIDLATLGGHGFRIDGAGAGDRTGRSVAAAGDVNGDGLADLLVGAHGADPHGRSNAGSAYVVFGKSSNASVDLAALGDRGFRIEGARASERDGWTVAPARDVNGDGRADMLVGALFADYNLRESSGSAYVVFGTATTATVDLAMLGDRGFRIDGAAARDFAGEAIAPAGDVNGDGKGDVLVGATFADNNGRESSGSAYVVLGKSTGATVDLAALGDQVLRVDGVAAGDGVGAAVAADDVDGDGRTDLLVGAPFADNNGRQGSGSVYVVSETGSSATVDLAAHGGDVRIDGAATLDLAGGSVSVVGDVNGDARADAMLGAAGAEGEGRRDSGSAYVVYLSRSGPTVDLAAATAPGFRIGGAGPEDAAGTAVAAAGDVNGDGRADALVGAPFADLAGRANAGAAYVVYGFGTPELAYDALVAGVGRRIGRHAPTVFRRTGPAGFTVSPALPAGLRLDPATGVVTGTPTVYARRTAYTVTMRDLAGSARAMLTITVIDRKAPQLGLGGPTVQSVLRRRTVTVRASCNEPCSLRASGTIRTLGAGPIHVGPTRAKLEAPGVTTVRLALSASGLRRLTALLTQGGRASATVTVRAVDRAGNASTAKRTIVLRS